MTKTTHTPTPWYINIRTRSCSIESGDRDYEVADHVGDVDAVHIVRCVNAHDALVAALAEFLDLCPRMSDDDPIAPALADACCIARAALAAAKEIA